MIEDVLPYLAAFLAPLVVTLLATPIVREVNRRLGMVDKPDPRRINKVPIPRGGGVALVFGVLVPYLAFHLVTGRPWIQGLSDSQAYVLSFLAVAIALLGFADDRFSLPPKAKLLGQGVVAVLVWAWAGLGFRVLWPALPAGLDCLLTVFWIVGAVNAFNLIDGLDGLASGLALIAVVGMAGALFFMRNPQATLFYFALAGGLLGFLRYNYHPASVFLGDAGSMFLGFTVSTLPLASQVPNSFLVSVGVPLLAMGVPIFDTALAILRRSVRHLLARRLPGTDTKAGEVMTADADHLHHRILRAVGLNQRKAAWILYVCAASLVVTGLVAMLLKSHAAGLWLAALAVSAVVIFKDAKIELFDASATVTGDADGGFTVTPGAGAETVEVTVPDGLDAAKVTVAVAPTVKTVRPNGATVRVVRTTESAAYDITDFLDNLKAGADGAVDLAAATVKEDIVKETLDAGKGAEVRLGDPSRPALTTAPTRPGLVYTLREGATLDAMTDGASTVGDGRPWTPAVKVKGGASGFYTIRVSK